MPEKIGVDKIAAE